MLHFLSGDLLLSHAEAIAHGVAPGDHFSHGLALALREQWPAMVKDFRHWCHNTSPKPGEAWLWSGAGGKRFVNLLTQDPPEAHHSKGVGSAKVEYVNHALKALHKIVEKEKFKSLALPKLATGTGGLDWAEVEPLIRQHLGDLKIPIYIYAEYHKGVAATEAA